MKQNSIVALLLSIVLSLTACAPAQQPTNTPGTIESTDSQTALETQLHYYLQGKETAADAAAFAGNGYSILVLKDNWNYQENWVGGYTVDLWHNAAEGATLTVLKMDGHDLAEAQVWLKETFNDYDLIEDSQGGMGGTNANGYMMDAQILSAGGSTYVLIKAYALANAETAGVYLTVMADTFQISGSVGLASHSQEDIAALCDTVYKMDGGELHTDTNFESFH